MNISCPHCGFSKSVEPDKVPDRPVKVNCPKCKQAFSFDKAALTASPARDQEVPEPAAKSTTEQITCPACGAHQDKGESCMACGVVYAKWQARQQEVAGASPEAETSAFGAAQLARIRKDAPGLTAEAQPKAGFWIRVVAYLLDSFIIGGVQLVLSLILGFSIGAMGGLSVEGETAMGVVTWLFGAALGMAYAVFFTGYCGQTPGKMAVRIKVILTDGSEISYGRAALREILGKFISGILLGIGYLMVAFDGQKQGLHDKIANTYVIKL